MHLFYGFLSGALVILLPLYGCDFLRAEKKGSDAGSDLTGTQWTLEAFEVDGRIEPVEPDEFYTLHFDSDSTVKAQAFCNRCDGEYEISSTDSISIGLGCTRALCGRSSEFQAITNTALRYEIVDEQLRLISERERAELHFSRLKEPAK